MHSRRCPSPAPPLQQLLWRLGDPAANPAAAARAFAAQHVQQPAQAEREAQRIQRDLEKLVEQHKDVPGAPRTPTLVKLEVRSRRLRAGWQLLHTSTAWLCRGPAAARRGASQACRPPAPALPQLRVNLAHLEAVFFDDPLWDLSAPRAACEDYIAQVGRQQRLGATAGLPGCGRQRLARALPP